MESNTHPKSITVLQMRRDVRSRWSFKSRRQSTRRPDYGVSGFIAAKWVSLRATRGWGNRRLQRSSQRRCLPAATGRLIKAPPAAATLSASAEDGAADTIRPRLEAAGANLDRVHIIERVIDEFGTRILAPAKNNLASEGNAIAFRIEQRLTTSNILAPYVAFVSPEN